MYVCMHPTVISAIEFLLSYNVSTAFTQQWFQSFIEGRIGQTHGQKPSDVTTDILFVISLPGNTFVNKIFDNNCKTHLP